MPESNNPPPPPNGMANAKNVTLISLWNKMAENRFYSGSAAARLATAEEAEDDEAIAAAVARMKELAEGYHRLEFAFKERIEQIRWRIG